MTKREHNFLQILQKIQISRGLVLEEASRLLGACKCVHFEKGAQVYQAGAPSTDMLILLSGRMLALTESGKILGEILPGSATGEMGLFTGHPRSASIEATEASIGLVLRKPDLENLMRTDLEMALKLSRNVIRMLSERLSQANAKIERQNGSAGVRVKGASGRAAARKTMAASAA